MIPIKPKPEPDGFDAQVRQKGLLWLKERQVDLTQRLPRGQKIPQFWVVVLKDLYDQYEGVCAYYAFRFQLASGAASTDHFVAKSKLPSEAYEWNNYRLACLGANRKKSIHGNLLDPFDLEEDIFRLNLDTGEIYINDNKPRALRLKAQRTIMKLGLDSEVLTKMRAENWEEYVSQDFTARHLRRNNPFVYSEALRQGRL